MPNMCAPADCLLGPKRLAGVAAVRCVECTSSSSSRYWGTRDEINSSTSGRVGTTALHVRCRERYYHEKHYKFTGATRALSRVRTSTCHRAGPSRNAYLGKKKNRDFYLILTRSFHLYIMAYKEIPVSGYWRVTRFRHLRQRRRRHKCYKRIDVIMLLETIWQSISRSRDEKSSFVPFIFSNIVTRFRCGRFRITTVFTTRSYIMKIRLKSGRRSQH